MSTAHPHQSAPIQSQKSPKPESGNEDEEDKNNNTDDDEDNDLNVANSDDGDDDAQEQLRRSQQEQTRQIKPRSFKRSVFVSTKESLSSVPPPSSPSLAASFSSSR